MECFSCGNPPSHECHCLATTLYYCQVCLPIHVLSIPSMLHSVQELNQPLASPLCSECNANICEAICLCQRVGICKSCLVPHVLRPGSHFIEYIRIEKKQSKDTFDMERKVSTTDTVKTEVVENIKHLEEFKLKVAEGKEIVMEALKKAADNLILNAENSKKKMEAALENIKGSKVPREDQWPYNFKRRQGSMTPSRRTVSMSNNMKLCETELNIENILKSVANIGKVTIFGDITPVQEIFLYYFKPKQREMITIEVSSFYIVKKIFPKALALPEAGSWCEGPQKQIIFCGGCKSTGFSNEVLLIDPITMNFRQLPNMKYPRAMAAVIFLNNCFYTFGGYSGTNLNTCEKFVFATGKWEELPNMPVSRSAFTLAVKDKRLYMSGDSNRVDVFDTESDIFIKCEIDLPEANYSTLVNHNGNLVLVQNESAWSIDLAALKIKKICPIPLGKWWSCFSPLVEKSLIIFARYDDGHLWILDVENNTIVKKFKLIG